MTHKSSPRTPNARLSLVAGLAAAGLVLAAPALAAAEQHGGGMSGAPHAGGMGGAPHGGGVGHGGVGHAGPAGVGAHGGPHPAVAPSGVYHGYDGIEQHDEHGNAGDRRGFGQALQSGRRFRGGAYHRPSGWYAHGWRVGDILPALFWAEDFWLMDYWTYDLSPPPYGFVWVRDDGDALLINRQTGEVVEVIYGVFY